MSIDGEKHKQITTLREELYSLKKQLQDLFIEKNSLNEQLNQLHKEIVGRISKISALKMQRDVLTSQVKEKKQEKIKFLEDLKSKSSELETARNENRKFIAEHKIQGNPSALKRDIMHIENKIETEVMPFEREEKLMKELKQKKKMFAGMKEYVEHMEKESSAFREINEIKHQIGSMRNAIQKTASESQVFHEQLVSISKEIDEFKTKENELFGKFDELKEQIKPLKKSFREKLEEFNKLRNEIRQEKQKRKDEKKQKERDILHEKELAVEDKLKRGKKLTTADLLVFQREGKDDFFDKVKRK